MVDRYRARGRLGARPARVDGRPGRRATSAGVTKAIESGELQALGVNTIWLTPLYANPDGQWPGPRRPRVHARTTATGPPSRARSRRRWPQRGRRRRARRRGARARHPRPLRRRARTTCTRSTRTGSRTRSERLVPGRRRLVRLRRRQLLLGHRRDGVLVHVVPAEPRLDERRRRRHRRRATSCWWLERFDGDGVRIDAVPMMPRAAVAPHRLGGARRRSTTRRTARYVLGENYTGQGGWPSAAVLPRAAGARRRVPLPAHVGAARRARRRHASRWSTSTRPSARASRRGRAPARSWGSSSTTTTRRASRRVAAGDDDGDTWTPAPQSTDPARVRAHAARARRALHAAGGAGPLLRRRGGARGQVRPRLAPRHAGRERPRRAADADARRGADARARRARARTRCGAGRTARCTWIAERLVFAREPPGADTAIVDLQRVADGLPVRAASRDSRRARGSTSCPGAYESLSSELTTLPAAPLSMALYVPASSPCAPGDGTHDVEDPARARVRARRCLAGARPGGVRERQGARRSTTASRPTRRSSTPGNGGNAPYGGDGGGGGTTTDPGGGPARRARTR